MVGLLTRFAGAVAAALGFVQAYALPFGWNCGPAASWWEPLRRLFSRLAGVVVDDRAGPRAIVAGEYAGSVEAELAAVERFLWDEGFIRNPLSRVKTRDNRTENGSWVYRNRPLARQQLHLMLFATVGGVDVYAHSEPSSVNPLVAASHFDGREQNVSAGVARAREVFATGLFELDARDATVTPTAAPWDAQPAPDENERS